MPGSGPTTTSVARIGFSPLKGAQHLARAGVDLDLTGPVGDRLFCLVDHARRQVLKTVQNPSLLAVRASFIDGVLDLALPQMSVAARPDPTGELLEVDYWGRRVRVEAVDGPWASAFSSYLGRPVTMVRVPEAGAIVYGASVTLVAVSAIGELWSRMPPQPGQSPVDLVAASARFRSTFLIDDSESGELSVGSEQSWVGRQLRVGAATIRVTEGVSRCAVVDLNPLSGQRDLPVLRAISERADNPIFGVQAIIEIPGRVHLGDSVTLSGTNRQYHSTT